jgi:hypothetical protein
VKRASDILARLLDEKTDEQARSGSGVFRSWTDIAGAPLSDHSRVYELQHDQLCVEVDHPGWLQVLLLRKKQILHRAARAYPQLKIRGLRARVNLSYGEPRPATAGPASPGAPGRPQFPAAALPGVPGPQEAEVEQAVSAAGSDDLKARLRRLFQASLRRSSRGSSRG